MTKYPILLPFYSNLNKFNNLNSPEESTKEKNATVYDNALELYNEYLGIYFNQYYALPDANKRKLGQKYDLIKSFLETYNYVWFENEESADTTIKRDTEESVVK